MSPNPVKRIVAGIFDAILPILRAVAPKQGNQFAFIVTKDGIVKPWLKKCPDQGLRPDMEYLNRRFDVRKYKK